MFPKLPFLALHHFRDKRQKERRNQDRRQPGMPRNQQSRRQKKLPRLKRVSRVRIRSRRRQPLMFPQVPRRCRANQQTYHAHYRARCDRSRRWSRQKEKYRCLGTPPHRQRIEKKYPLFRPSLFASITAFTTWSTFIESIARGVFAAREYVIFIRLRHSARRYSRRGYARFGPGRLVHIMRHGCSERRARCSGPVSAATTNLARLSIAINSNQIHWNGQWLGLSRRPAHSAEAFPSPGP